MEKIKVCGLLLCAIFLSSCALTPTTYEKPEVSLVSFQPLSRKGVEQMIVIQLSIKNNAEKELNVSKFSYSLKLEDLEAISGVFSNLKPIPAFGGTKIEFHTSMNVFSVFRILESVIKSKNGTIRYELNTKMHSAWWKLPSISVKFGYVNLGRTHSF
jgi:LEA14-like dessication related protein|tara:strand:- start:5838 stop:6308 length:471 start_codon:yes stop_codon:yes gene_type:complete